MSCGASSGGTPLRHIGRIGPVACYGSGIYCRDYLSTPPNNNNNNNTSSSSSNNGKVIRNIIGSCTSGTGEHIMQTLLANNICNYYNLTNDEKTLMYMIFIIYIVVIMYQIVLVQFNMVKGKLDLSQQKQS